MRIRRKNRSARKRVCAAKWGRSRPSSTPASMARKVNASRDGLRKAAIASSTMPALRSSNARVGWPSRAAPAPLNHSRTPIVARRAMNLGAADEGITIRSVMMDGAKSGLQSLSNLKQAANDFEAVLNASLPQSRRRTSTPRQDGKHLAACIAQAARLEECY